jgi:hypothetical protein
MTATITPGPDAPASTTAPREPAPLRLRVPLFVLLNVVVVGALYHMHRGVFSDRIANRAVDGAPRPVGFLFGKPDWIVMHEVGFGLMLIAIMVLFAIHWQRHPKHPVLLMVIAATGLVWLDPVMNWAPYAVYNPELTHWPETWPLVSLSPSVEPFVVLGYVTFYAGPALPAIWVLRRIQARRPLDSFVWRHPLVSLVPVIFAIGFVFDLILEIVCIRTGLYIYAQTLDFGTLWAGEWYQFPLLWESSLVTLVMIPAGLLLYRDDTGKTQAEKLAHRVRAFRGRPALGTFVVMFAILNVAYLGYGGAYAAIRASGAATSLACPWPYPEAKVYDPQGFYEEAGQPGPYYPGIWAGWPTAQAGRPDVDPPDDGGRCGAGGD